MLKIKIRNTSGLVTGHAKLPILVVVIVCMACLVPLSMPAPRAYSQSSNDAIPLDDSQMSQYFEVPVPDSDDKGFFYLTAPDGWTKMQIQPYIDGIETVSAAEFLRSRGLRRSVITIIRLPFYSWKLLSSWRCSAARTSIPRHC